MEAILGRLVRTTAVCVGVLLLTGVGFAAGEQPLEVLRGPIEEGLKILRQSGPQDAEGRAATREKIWTVVRETFDFTEISKRALARNWRDLTPSQREVFAEAFADLLGYTYIEKMLAGYDGEEVDYIGQRISGRKAVVQTRIIRQATEIPVDYSMLQRDDGWKVYDVNIEGVSLVKNYRVQFNRYLQKHSGADLIERLQEKAAAQMNK